MSLPNGWTWVHLADVCLSVTDGDHQPPPQAEAGVPFVVIGNIRNGYVDFTGCRHVTPDYYETLSPIRRPQRGDVLYSLVGSFGIPALVKVDQPFCVQRHIAIVRPSRHISPPFLAYALASPVAYDQASACATGTAQKTVPLAGVRSLLLPLPPRKEQDRIVAAVEQEFSRIDAGIASLDRAKARMSQIVRASLQAMIPIPGSTDWRRTIVDMAGEVSLGRQRAPKYHKGPNMRSYLRVANVFEDRIDTGDIMEMQFDDREFEQYRLHPGDILLNEGQSPELLGRPALYRGIPENVAFTNSLIRFRPHSDVLPEWALLVFRRHFHTGRFAREARITTNIAHLSAGRFKSVEFVIPPLDEQKRIVELLATVLSDITAIESSVGMMRRRAARLRLTVLKAAFVGRLVPEARESSTHAPSEELELELEFMA